MFLENDEMKFIALYALKRYQAPITSETFYEIITWDNEIMGFFDAASALNELLSSGYVEKTFYRNKECYVLSKDGEKTLELFGEKFPKSIQNRIDDAIGKMRYDTLSAPDASYAEVVPVNRTDYAARLTYLENHTPMLELTINAGSRKNAEMISKNLEEKAKEIYENVLKMCIPEE